MIKSQSNKNNIVLSYHDCLLRQADVDLLHGSHWLNDAIIGFYFEYLEHKYDPVKTKLMFACPEITQLLKLNASNEYSIILDSVDAKSKEFIFFPLNDCNSRDSAGGSHWSLLVFSKNDKACYHFDSSRGLTAPIARDFSKGIMHYLLENKNGRFIEIDCPQQDNGYDCGLFVLCFTDLILENVYERCRIEECSFKSIKTQVSGKRNSLLNLIHKLQEVKECGDT